MINVAFLLLVFLLLAAELSPPPPLDVRPPEAASARPAPPAAVVLHVAADGTLALGALRGAAALAAIPEGVDVLIRADAALPAADLAALLPRLARAGAVGLAALPSPTGGRP